MFNLIQFLQIRAYFVDLNNKFNRQFALKYGVKPGFGYRRVQFVCVTQTGKPSKHYRLYGGKFELGTAQFNNSKLMEVPNQDDFVKFFNQLIQNKLEQFYISESVANYCDSDENVERFKNINNLENHIKVSNVKSTSWLGFVHKIVGINFKEFTKKYQLTCVIYFSKFYNNKHNLFKYIIINSLNLINAL